MELLLPKRGIALAIVRRGILIWLLVRAMVLVLAVAMGGHLPSRSQLTLAPGTAIFLVLIVGGLGVLEARRVNEHRFLSNLGISPAIRVALALLPALCGEILVGIVASR